MFIIAYILFGLALIFLVMAIFAFFKLDVKSAYNFTRNRRTPGESEAAKKIKPRKQKTKYKPSRDISKINVSNNFVADDSSTENLDEASEQETDLLNEESEQPTGILDEDTEKPTGILVEESEQPTGILDYDTESPTGILVEESENPTGILSEESEQPTGVLSDDIAHKKVVSSKKVKKSKPVISKVKSKLNKEKILDSEFKFELIKNEIVIHTDESIS